MTLQGRVQLLQPVDTRDGFERAAEERYVDGLSLRMQGQRTAAVYMWGYTTEMLLKAAVLRAAGYPPAQPIRRNTPVGSWTIQLHHDLPAYANQLISIRASQTPLALPVSLGLTLHVRSIWNHWRETLRYKYVAATDPECEECLQSAEWLMTNYANF